MAGKYKRSFRMYAAWNYGKEIEDLNRASEQGWQLVKGGCFHSRFVKDPGVRYRYQLDYGKIDNMGRYLETFREQGWEYVNSTFNGWHYFRKVYDPEQPEEAYEIFTDRESLHEMNSRWARLALIIGLLLGAFAAVDLVRAVLRPSLPVIVRLATLAIESAVLLRGWRIMRNPEASRSRRGSTAFLAVFLAVILLGAAGSIFLQDQRPHFSTNQGAASIEQPIVDSRWADFEVRYADHYYLDLTIDAEAPLTFEILDADGTAVCRVTEDHFQEEDISLWLPVGHYCFSMSCETGFRVDCELE